MRKIFTLTMAAVLLAGCTITLEPLGAKSETGDQPAVEAPPIEQQSAAELPQTGSWSCFQDSFFNIADCHTKAADTEKSLFWRLQLVCLPNGATAQWIWANTNDLPPGDPKADWLLWEDASSVNVRLDGLPDQWPIALGPDSHIFQFKTASTANKSAWDFLSKIAPAQTLSVEVADAEGRNYDITFEVSDSVTAAAFLAVNGCSGSGPG